MSEEKKSPCTEAELEAGFWRRFQHSMAMEGYEVSQEQIVKWLKEHEDSGRGEKVSEVCAKARAEGRSIVEALREARAKGEIPK